MNIERAKDQMVAPLLRRFLRHALVLILLALPLAVLVPDANGFPYPNDAARYSDVPISHYPNAIYFRRALLQEGRLPLWSPNILSGAPFAANPLAGMWYPPGWLALALPLPLGFNLLIMFHLLWGGIGMCRLLRQEGLGYMGAIFGGVGFELLPKLFAHFGAGHVSLLYALPWTPWLLFAARCNAEKNNSWKEAIILAMIFLADPRWSAYAGLLWAAKYFFTSRPREWLSLGYRIVRQCLMALLLAAPLALPLWEFTRLSSRATMDVQDVLTHSLAPVRLLGMFYPDWGGFHEYMIYSGQAALVLCLVAWLTVGRNPSLRFWMATALVAVLWALGSYLPPIMLLARLPGLDLLRVPSRSLFLWGLAIIVSAAYAVDHLSRNPFDAAMRRCVSLATTGLATFSLALIGGIWLLGRSIPMNFLWGGAFMLASSLWINLRLQRRLSNIVWLAGLIIVCLADWLVMDLSLFTYRSPNIVLAEGKTAAEFLADQNGQFRVYSPSYSLPQQSAILYGLELTDGVDPLQLQSYVSYMQIATGVPQRGYSVTMPPFANADPDFDNAFYVPDPERLGKLNVAYVAAAFDLSLKGLEYLGQFDSVRIYRNLAWRPRSWIQPEQFSSEWDDRVQIIEWKPERIELQAQGPGILTLSEINYPGWRVWVDGEERPIVVVEGLLRAVELPAGNHRVMFAFRPMSVYLGMALCGTACLFILFSRRLRFGGRNR
ncbi:MAG: hypothetical protein QME21_15445 [Anaerolineales bacterium]|nr:hypothetical protein [Anaerolineales bacterium]